MTFITGTFQFHSKSGHKQLKWNKITRDMCKSDSIFPYLRSCALFNDIWNLFLDKVYQKDGW